MHRWPWLPLLAACGPDATLGVTPASVPMSGYVSVTLDLSDLSLQAREVRAVRVAGIAAIDLQPDGDDSLRVQVQGAPVPGPADVVLTGPEGDLVFPAALRYAPNADPVFDRMVAFGASLTQGVQGGVPTQHAQLMSPFAWVARRAGAHFPLPLLVPDLFPTIGPADIGPPPTCAIPDVVLFVAEASVEVIAKLEDEENDRIGFYLARVDPDLFPADVAVGGSTLHDTVHPTGDDFAKGFVAKMVFDPFSDILDPVARSQLDLVEDAAPTIVFSTDMYGNDLIAPIMLAQKIDPTRLPPLDEVRDDMTELVERLAATGAAVFVANMPRPTLLPATEDKRAAEIADAVDWALAQGNDPELAAAEAAADVDERIAAIEQATLDANAILDELAAGHASVHVVDFAGRVAEIESEPLLVGGQTLTVKKLGGLLSTDGVHFSDAGYAMVANLFLDEVEAQLGIHLERVDLAPVVDDDPYAPASLRAGGLDPSLCHTAR